jgi:ubiquinone/menaquinone biosynthesis C-methylase UbiE
MTAICSSCKKPLPQLSKNDSGEYVCGCGKSFIYRNGIFKFIENDAFYEGKFTSVVQQETLWQKIIVFIKRCVSIDGNEERMWRKSVKIIKRETNCRKLEILNIGAGGGHAFLTELGDVTAVDLSYQSLLNAQRIYDSCYQADAKQLPFPDESFDLVFSAHLLGHIPLTEKQKVIQEIFRVTKHNGYSLHSAECEADNIIYKKAKAHPALYQKYFIDMYGHYGLELPSACKQRFRDVGFEPILELSDYCKGIVRPIESYHFFFSADEFQTNEIIFKLLDQLSKFLTFFKPLHLLTNIVMFPFTLVNRFWDSDSTDSIKVLYRKRQN